jgi:S1-C subfamily serine protease
MRHLLVAILFATLLSGCTSVQTTRLDFSKYPIKQVCIEENIKTSHMGVLRLIQRSLQERGIDSSVFRGTTPMQCKYTLSYSARNSWDITIYLKSAEFKIRIGNKIIAEATYHHGGGFDLSKFGSAESKLLPVLDALFSDFKRVPSMNQNKPNQSSGSGFFVSKLGHIVTNEHVVRQCGSVTVGDNANKQLTASVLEIDKRNDLALLRISSTQMAELAPLASEGLFKSDDVELGEDVLVAGYPYGDLFSNSIKVTKGIVSSNKGMGNDKSQFQIDAAVQSGNSGGPIYDENGNIVGVVISQLNKLKVAKAIGSLPENVNFGIKASTVRLFLTYAGLATKRSNRTEQKTTKELAQIAMNQTVMVVCNP